MARTDGLFLRRYRRAIKMSHDRVSSQLFLERFVKPNLVDFLVLFCVDARDSLLFFRQLPLSNAIDDSHFLRWREEEEQNRPGKVQKNSPRREE